MLGEACYTCIASAYQNVALPVVRHSTLFQSPQVKAETLRDLWLGVSFGTRL